MNARKKAVKVKGAVLLMILAVMTVLIILLAGSIAVVYSTHNRTQLKFKESQAYYTARSMVEEFVDYMMNDISTMTNYEEFYYVKKSDGNYEEEKVKLNMAGAIEMDLYKVPVSPNSDWYLSRIAECGGDAAKIQEFKDSVNLTDAVINADPNHTTFDKYYNQYKCSAWDDASSVEGVDDTITYTVDSSTDLRNYGKVGSTVYGSLFYDDSTTLPPIKVQILEREFDMGEGSTVAERIRNGDRRNDHIVARVYVEVDMENDTPVSTSLVIGSRKPSKGGGGGAIVSMGSVASQASLRAIGGTSSLFPGWIELDNYSESAGNIFINGSMKFNTSPPHIYLSGYNNEMMFVKDVLRVGGMPVFHDKMEAATIYAGVTEIACGGGQHFGSPTTRVNLITQRFQVDDGAQLSYFHGQIFADEFVLTNGSLSNGGNLSALECEGKMDANVYCNYLSIPDTNVSIKYCNDGKALIQLDRGPQDSNLDGFASLGFNGVELKTDGSTARPFYNYFGYDKTVTIYKGIKIIKAGGVSAADTSSGKKDLDHNYKTEKKKWDGTDLVMDPVPGFNYHEEFKSGGKPEENRCLNFGDPIVGPDGNTYTLELDNTASTKYQPGSGAKDIASDLLDLRYEIPTAVYNKAKQEAMLHGPSSPEWTEFMSLHLEGDFTRKITLPVELYVNGTKDTTKNYKEISLPTERSIFGDYFFDYVGKGGPNTANIDGYHADIDYDKTAIEYNTSVLTEWQDTTGYHNSNTEHRSPSGDNWDGWTWTHNGAFNLDLSDSYDDDTSNDKIKLDDKNQRVAYIKSRIINSEVFLEDTHQTSLVKFTAEVPTTISDGTDVNGYTIPSGATVISGSGILPTSHNGTYYIDARANAIDLQIGSGTDSGWGNYQITGSFVVVGNQPVSIYIVGNGKDNETINLGSTGNGFSMWADYLMPSTVDIRIFGAQPETPSPNINYYVAHNIEKIQLYEGGGVSTILCGYFYGPMTSADFSTSMNASNASKKTYYGPTIKGNKDLDEIGTYKSYVFGNIICAEVIMGQQAGVTYIPIVEIPPYGSKKLNFDGVGASR